MKKPIKAEVVDRSSKKSTTSGVARGAVGAAIAGPAGMVAGAALAKNKDIVTFLVTYDDGSVDEISAKRGSLSHKRYMDLLEENIKANNAKQKKHEEKYGKKNVKTMRKVFFVLLGVLVLIVILCIVCS